MGHRRYTTDLTDRQWAAIADLVPSPKPGGRPAKYPRREVVNAIFYQARNGCTWRDLPADLPPYRTVFHYFRAWQRAGVWQGIHDRLRERTRRRDGRRPMPSAGVLDSQTVKTVGPAEARGYGGGKNVVGRKRHLLVDTSGLILAVMVTAASVSDVLGGKLVLLRASRAGLAVRRIWADYAYRGLVAWTRWPFWCVAEVVRRAAGQRGFHALPRRWVVERTFAWLGKYRRLSKDYERTCSSSEAFIYIAMTSIMLRRLCRT